MKGRNTFNLWFYIRSNRVDNKGLVPIYMRITVNGVDNSITINRKISEKSWDVKRGCAKPRMAEADEINAYLESLRRRVFEAHRQLIEEGKVVTPDAVLSIVLGLKERNYTLIKLMERHNKNMEDGLGITSSPGNFKNFKTSLKYLKEFVKAHTGNTDVLLAEIDNNFIDSYILYLQKEKNCHHNGAMKQLQRLKKVFNLGVNYGWISKTPFSNYKIKFKPYDKIILTAEELEKVENLKGLNPKLEITRDAFIFSCYTGLAYVDLRQLTTDNIIIGVDGNPWIITRRKKTDIKARIPLLPKALALIEKYKNHRKVKDGQVIPVYSNQKTNDYLKEIARKAEISKPLSFHCGRHIFATVITLANGVPIETVSKALGHTDIRTTQVYARVLDEKIGKDFTNLKNSLQK